MCVCVHPCTHVAVRGQLMGVNSAMWVIEIQLWSSALPAISLDSPRYLHFKGCLGGNIDGVVLHHKDTGLDVM